MGIELESYADQLRDEWMPGYILITRVKKTSPPPLKDIALAKEMEEIKILEDQGLIIIDVYTITDRDANKARDEALKRKRENRDDREA